MKKIQKSRLRRSAEDSKNRILSAALNRIEKVGWEDLSIQAIARECNTSPSNILYHFKDKASLLRALLEQISKNNYQTVENALTPRMDARERLHTHFKQNLLWARSFPQEAQIVIHIYMESTHDQEFSILFRDMLDRAQDRIEEIILAGLREKLMSSPLATRSLAKLLHNLLVGAFISIVGTRLSKPFTYSDREWHLVLDSLTCHDSPPATP